MPRDSSDIYYRPVLQPKDWEGKPLHVVTLVVNGTNYKVITAEDTITLPSINGLLSDPDDDLLYGYYWYNAKTSKYYRSSSQIPVTDGMTLEAVENSGIKITDKNGKDYLLTGDDNKLDLDDGGHVYYNPILLRLTLKDANLQGIEYDGTLILLLDGRNSIAAKGDADAICARDLDIRSSSTNDGILTISAEKGLAYRSIGNNTSYSQSRSEQPISGERKNPHITMPASALKQFEEFNFYGGTLTLLGAETDTFVGIDERLQKGQIADARSCGW